MTIRILLNNHETSPDFSLLPLLQGLNHPFTGIKIQQDHKAEKLIKNFFKNVFTGEELQLRCVLYL